MIKVAICLMMGLGLGLEQWPVASSSVEMVTCPATYPSFWKRDGQSFWRCHPIPRGVFAIDIVAVTPGALVTDGSRGDIVLMMMHVKCLR